jgi:acetolactate synthase small subunit
MSTHVNDAKQIFHEKVESQINTVVAKLEALRARAEGARADVTEAKAIAELLVKKQAIEHMLKELKKSNGHEWDHSKAALVARIAEFEALVKGIESKTKSKAKAKAN